MEKAASKVENKALEAKKRTFKERWANAKAVIEFRHLRLEKVKREISLKKT